MLFFFKLHCVNLKMKLVCYYGEGLEHVDALPKHGDGRILYIILQFYADADSSAGVKVNHFITSVWPCLAMRANLNISTMQLLIQPAFQVFGLLSELSPVPLCLHDQLTLTS